MKTLRWAIAQLPDVRPRLASVAIKNGLVDGVMEDIHFIHGDLGPTFLIGPEAARLILEAYRSGLLPMENGKQPQPAPAIERYLKNEDALASEAASHRLARKNSDPFTDWRAMEELFRRKGHPVPATLSENGTMIERRFGTSTKDPRPEQIRFCWTDNEGRNWILDRRHQAYID